MTDNREIFARNLRILIGPRSVSRIARDVGINRTQFNRYLTGETLPKAELLLRICRFFGTDANILLYPLDATPEPIERTLLRRVLSECTVTFNPDPELIAALAGTFAGEELAARLHSAAARSGAFPNEYLATLAPSHVVPLAPPQPHGDLS